jgi:molybdopterin molybdotransferase
MVERTTLLPAEAPGGMCASVRIDSPPMAAGQNIVRQGASMRRGDTVLAVGQEIRPIEIGILAEVGRTRVGVIRKPTVAVLSTGNELAAIDEIPQAGHIRNSNGPMLMALAKRAGANVMSLGIGRDDLTQLRDLISQGLTADVLILSGGVSAGVLDLVPQALADLGVKQVFHKVSVKPGKPLWFGVAVHNERPTLVFGLPGNPVSSLVCFEVFVRPALAKLQGRDSQGLPRIQAPLAQDFEHRGDRTTFYPARLENGAVKLLSWKGSGDLRTLAEATALAHFPPGNQSYHAGTLIDVLLNL